MSVIVLILLPLLSWADSSCQHSAKEFNCVKFLKNYDGDTITVTIPNVPAFLGSKAKVRVLGIDCPEMKTKNQCEKSKAILARDFVRSELERAKRIDLKDIGRDKYGRILAQVIYDGKNLGQLLLEKKMAYTYTGKRKRKINWCAF